MAHILNFKNEYEGLTSAQAEDRLRMYGLNRDTGTEEPSYSVKKALLCPRFFTQAAAVVLLFLSGNIVMGTVMLLITVILTMGDIIWQLKLNEKASVIKRMAGMKFRAVRNGELVLVRKEYLVPDDIIVLQGGERVPADAHLLEAEELTLDESLLTGSSAPAVKRTGSDSGKTVPKSTCIYKNTVVLTGGLVARVFATGEDAVLKREENRSTSRFEKILNKQSLLMAAAGAAAAVLTALLCLLRAGTLSDIADVLSVIVIPALSVGMCFLPSQANMLVKSYYYNGMARLSRRHALVKNIGTVEALSAITCVCVEKTGTVTKNQLEVADVFTEGPKFFTNVCVLACEPTPSSSVEKAILLYAAFNGADAKDLFSNRRIAAYPFSEESKMAGNLWEIGGQRLMCIKGSPEEVITLCNVEPNELHYIQQKKQSYTKMGRQVLAVAFAALPADADAPESLHSLRYEYIGLIALENRTRDTVPYAVKSCLKAGVRVIMITGDNEETAMAIGRQIGLQSVKTMTGAELEKYGDNVPADLSEVSIFARVTPQQRLQLIKTLRSSGEIVALVGTGSEVVQLLEEADVGISVNGSSTPAAEESSDMLMSDDNFLAAADAVKEARQIHRNVKSAISLMLAGHIALAAFALVAVSAGGAAIFTPVLAALLTCVLFPLAGSMLMNNSADVKSDFTSSGFIGKGHVNRFFMIRALISGASLAVVTVLFYLFTIHLEAEVQRSMLLFMMAAGLILECLTYISEKKTFVEAFKEKHGFSGMLASGIILLSVLILMYVPYLNTAFGFASPSFLVVLIAFVLTVLFTLWVEVAKRMR